MCGPKLIQDEWNGQEAGHWQTARLAELQKELGETTNTRTVRVLEQVLQAEPKVRDNEPVHCQEDRGVPEGETGLGQGFASAAAQHER